MPKQRDKAPARPKKMFKQNGLSNGTAVSGEMLELLSNLSRTTAVNKDNASKKKQGDIATQKNVAVITLLGTFCPVTISHVDAFVQARKVLLAQRLQEEGSLENFDLVLGFVSLNPDQYVNSKFIRMGNAMAPLQYKERRRLVQMAVEPFQSWVGVEDWEGCSLENLRRQFPRLSFTHFYMNGADDVLKCKKWRYATEQDRFITMGRPGKTEELLRELRAANVDPRYFVVGPELADVSSTRARGILEKYQEASSGDDAESIGVFSRELDKLLAPPVKEWCISKGPWAPVEK